MGYKTVLKRIYGVCFLVGFIGTLGSCSVIAYQEGSSAWDDQGRVLRGFCSAPLSRESKDYCPWAAIQAREANPRATVSELRKAVAVEAGWKLAGLTGIFTAGFLIVAGLIGATLKALVYIIDGASAKD